jgi:hypothetical protein
MIRNTNFGAGLDQSVFDHYLLSFYFVEATFITWGVVEQLTPGNFEEVVFAIFVLLLNMILFVYIFGQVSSLVMKADDKVLSFHHEGTANSTYCPYLSSSWVDYAYDPCTLFSLPRLQRLAANRRWWTTSSSQRLE